MRSRLQLDDTIKKGSILNVTQQIVEKHGVYGLFQGWWSAVVCLGASNFVYFYTYNAFKTIYQVKVLKSRKVSIDPINNLWIAFMAAVVNVYVTTPLWVVNTRLTVQDTTKKMYNGVFDCLMKIAQNEGWKNLWSGVMSGVVLASNPSIQFVVYERLREPLVNWVKQRSGPKAAPTPIQFFMIAAIAKAIATVLTYPIQTAQAKLRNDKKKEYKGTWHCMSTIAERDGYMALFKGMEAKLYQTVLMAAFQFMTYEQTNKFVTGLLMPSKAAQAGHWVSLSMCVHGDPLAII